MFLYIFVDFVNRYLNFFFLIKNSFLSSLNIRKIAFSLYSFAFFFSFLLILSSVIVELNQILFS